MKPTVLLKNAFLLTLLCLVVLALLPSSARAQFIAPARAAVAGLSTAADVAAALLGEELSVNRLVLTEARTTEDGLVLNGARLRLRMNGANDTWIQATDTGVWASQPYRNCVTCRFLTDGIVSAAGGVPVTIYEPKGLRIDCKASLDTCNSTLGQGTQQTACASATSRTRVCTCTASSDSTPTYAWALAGGSGTVGTTTTCPDVTP